MVGLQSDAGAFSLVGYVNPWCHLHVIRQTDGDYPVALLVLSGFIIGGVLHAVVTPLRDRPFYQLSPSSLAPHADFERWFQVVLSFHPRIKPYIRLRQPEVCVWCTTGLIGLQSLALPRGIGHQPDGRGINDDTRLSAADMRKAFLAEIAQQQSHIILTFPQKGCQIYHVIVGVRAVRPSFQTALEHCQRPVHPQPVFRVGSNPRLNLPKRFLQHEVLAELYPRVLSVPQRVVCRNPMGRLRSRR